MSPRLLLGLAVAVAAAAPAAAQPRPVRAAGHLDESPEKLLSPTTQLYVKWDGIAAHKEAYEASVWGPVMKGPTGDTLRTLLTRGPKLLGSTLLADPLLDGKPPDELRAVHADLKSAEKALELVADKGFVLAAEIAGPKPTLGGLGKAVGGLLKGEGPAPEAFLPDARVLLVVPDIGDKADILFGSLRLLTRQSGVELQPLPAGLAPAGFMVAAKGGEPVHVGWWVEGRHFVLYAGTTPVDAAVKGLRENAKKGGITGHLLFQRALKTGEFDSVCRGYVDTGSVVGLAKRLAGPFVPGLSQRLDDLGLGNLKAVVFSSGFQGKESRALYEFDLPGERKGLARVLKPQPLTLNDLPPFPPDVSRFSALRVDLPATYDAGLTLVDTLLANEQFGVEDKGKNPAEVTRLRKEYLARELDKFVGVDVQADLLPHLGDRVVIFQTPTEGLSVFGTVVCVSVKDPVRVKAATDRMHRVLETIAGGPMKVRKKVLRGVEMREVYGRGFGVLTPTYAVVGDWLVVAGHPQPIQGLILRQKGELERWRPDAETAARLSRMPSDAVGIQYCRPDSVVKNLTCIGPLFLSTVSRFGRDESAEFNPIDIGLIPNGHELSRHLFPNLTYTRDDGKTIRIETNESFSLPLEFIGAEPFLFSALVGLF